MTMRMMNVILCMFVAAAVAAENKSAAVLERSVGRVILEKDKDPRRHDKVSATIQKEYKHIRKLPVAQRVRFFWSVMMNVNLDASYSVEFLEMVAHDCSQEFERELVAFIEKKGTLPPLEPNTSIAKRMLTSLRLYRERSQQQPPSR